MVVSMASIVTAPLASPVLRSTVEPPGVGKEADALVLADAGDNDDDDALEGVHAGHLNLLVELGVQQALGSVLEPEDWTLEHLECHVLHQEAPLPLFLDGLNISTILILIKPWALKILVVIFNKVMHQSVKIQNLTKLCAIN